MQLRNSRAPRRARNALSIVCAFGVAAGCAGADGESATPAPADPPAIAERTSDVGSTGQTLLNGVTFGDWSQCQAAGKTHVSQWAFVARTLLTSAAFEQCVRQRVATNYISCSHDPGGAETAIWAARSASSALFTCFRTPGDGRLGWAGVNAGPNYDTELLSWGNWLDDAVVTKLNGLSTNADDAPDRWAPFPWPLTDAANVLVHENLHWQGYDHWDDPSKNAACLPSSGVGGACSSDAQCTAPATCRFGGGVGRCATYDMGANSMPYIVGGCMSELIERSQARCGGGICSTRQADDLSSCDARGALNVVNDFDNAAAGCSVRYDPAKRGIGAIHIESGAMRSTDIVANGQPITSDWRLSSADSFSHRTPSNLDPGAGEEVLVSSGWGAGVIGTDANNRLKTFAVAPWESLANHAFNGSGTWVLRSGDSFSAAGKTSTQSDYGTTPLRDELLVTNSSNSEWGLLSVVSGAFRTRGRFLVGSQAFGPFGHWTQGASDTRQPAGDVNGNGRADVLVRSSWGIGLVSLTGTNGSLETIDVRGNGDRIGGWLLSANDGIGPFGDFNGDGRRDFVIKSAWGMGLIGIPAGQTRMTTLWSQPWGAIDGGWTLSFADELLSASRYTFTTRDSLLVRNASSGIAIVSFPPGTNLVASVASGQRVAFNGHIPGGWALGAQDNVIFWATGDYDNDGFTNILVSSGWGIGVIGRSASSGALATQALTARDCGNDPTDHACHGSLWGSWLNRDTDSAVASIKASSGGALVLMRSATTD